MFLQLSEQLAHHTTSIFTDLGLVTPSFCRTCAKPFDDLRAFTALEFELFRNVNKAKEKVHNVRFLLKFSGLKKLVK